MEQQPFQANPSPTSIPPKNWLVESILVTIFCCIIFGILGIIQSSKVNSLWAAGDYAGAERASKEAGKWTKIGFFVGLGLQILVWVIYGTVIFALIRSGRLENNYQ